MFDADPLNIERPCGITANSGTASKMCERENNRLEFPDKTDVDDGLRWKS